MLQAPLLLGCDVRNITKENMEIIANKEVISVNQGKYKLWTDTDFSFLVSEVNDQVALIAEF